MVRPERFELPTLWFEAKCSIQLSYGRVLNISVTPITPGKVPATDAPVRRSSVHSWKFGMNMQEYAPRANREEHGATDLRLNPRWSIHLGPL